MSETITAKMAQWAADLEYDDIGDKAIHEARRYLLDSLGCAFGGFRQEDVRIALALPAPIKPLSRKAMRVQRSL